MTHVIRWMVRRDLASVLAIELASFEYPWSEADFIGTLRQKACIGLVAEYREQVVGYVVFVLRKRHIEILNLAVDTDSRRRGVGAAMVARVRKTLSSPNGPKRDRITLLIRETNLPGLLFFQRQGFSSTRLLRGFHDSEDAIEMQWRKVEGVVAGNRVAKFLEGNR